MNALIDTEVFKLRTARSTWGFLAGGLALGALLGAATSATAGEDVAAALGTADNMANVLGVSALPGVLMLILGILMTAGEYQHRTITQTFLTTPVRGRVMAAKLAALALVGLPVALAVMGAALLAALPRLLTAADTIDLFNAERLITLAALGKTAKAAELLRRVLPRLQAHGELETIRRCAAATLARPPG